MSALTAMQRIQQELLTDGLARSSFDLALRAVNKVVLLKILKGMTVERVDPSYLGCPEPYRATFLDKALLRRLGEDPVNGLPGSFLDEALSAGDECYGFLAGETLAAYGWYSRRPTPIDPPDLVLHPGGQYVYMYKGFTHPEHRGQRLHAIGMTLALQHYLRRGYKGLVSYVEANNFASLKSVGRMGYEIFGSACVLGILGIRFTHASAGWRAHGVRIGPAVTHA
jgi:hypothetical protein